MPRLQEPISAPVNVRCLFYRKDNRRRDLTNLLEAIDDIMVETGVIADDNYHISRGMMDPAYSSTKKIQERKWSLKQFELGRWCNGQHCGLQNRGFGFESRLT